mgnify:CR=1 FL=1
MMLHDVLETYPSLRQQISVKDEQLISSLIAGETNSELCDGKEFMYEIVSNSRNGVDVDKFDYLVRDAQKTNMNYNAFNHDKVMRGARVI